MLWREINSPEGEKQKIEVNTNIFSSNLYEQQDERKKSYICHSAFIIIEERWLSFETNEYDQGTSVDGNWSR